MPSQLTSAQVEEAKAIAVEFNLKSVLFEIYQQYSSVSTSAGHLLVAPHRHLGDFGLLGFDRGSLRRFNRLAATPVDHVKTPTVRSGRLTHDTVLDAAITVLHGHRHAPPAQSRQGPTAAVAAERQGKNARQLLEEAALRTGDDDDLSRIRGSNIG